MTTNSENSNGLLGDKLNAKVILDNAILTESWPIRSYRPDPSCSAKSYVTQKIENYFDDSSDGEDIENFFKELDINFEKDTGFFRYSGSYELNTNRNTTPSSTNITVYYKPGVKEKFDRAFAE
jgi:hypothetical protein